MLSLVLVLSSRADAAIVINELLADPGLVNDANCDATIDSLQDEFVEIVNSGPGTVDISGFTVNDLVGVRHTFPAGTTLTMNQAVVVYGGGTASCVANGVRFQVSSTGTLGLNNTADTLRVVQGSGYYANTVATYSYGGEANADQSITLSPDLDTSGAMVQHSTVSAATMSPGRTTGGVVFAGGGVPNATLSNGNQGYGYVDWTLTYGAANTMYVLIGSLTPGQFVHPLCPNDPASMSNPQVIGQATTNAQGTATFTAVIPAAVRGRTTYVQAAAASVCDITNLVTQVF